MPREGIAKATTTRTNVPANHKGCRTSAPALPLIGTPTATANGVQAMPFNHLTRLPIRNGASQFDAEPLRLLDKVARHSSGTS